MRKAVRTVLDDLAYAAAAAGVQAQIAALPDVSPTAHVLEQLAESF